MDVYEAVKQRRSIRRFQDLPVPYEALEKCADAGRLAPTGRNRQLCEYIIVDDAPLVSGVFDCITVWPSPGGRGGGAAARNGPKAFILILINKVREVELAGISTITNHDVGFAAENMILVALEQGLGSCPVVSFDDTGLRRLLHIPGSYDIALLLALGYPAETPVADVSDGPVQFRADRQGVWHVPKRKLVDITHHNGFLP